MADTHDALFRFEGQRVPTVLVLGVVERKPLGDQRRSQDIATVGKAVKSVGFSNRETARQARIVVRRGTPELVEAMDLGQIAIEPAALVAKFIRIEVFDGARRLVMPAQVYRYKPRAAGSSEEEPALFSLG
jgi:hypothetical protein